MAGGIYPLARAEALRGLAAVLEKVDASGGAGRGVMECCYGCAVELMRDDDEGVRLAAMRLVSLCAENFALKEDVDGTGDGDKMDLIFLQVRTAACKSLGALANFSSQYALKSLDLLMDMMNDDTEAVRLQTLQALFHMATYGYFSVQEKHMHMGNLW